MRTRKKQYTDYGMSDERVRELLAFCRNPDNAEMVRKASSAANPWLSNFIFVSLTTGKGFDRQFRYAYHLPSTKADFYAYRRLAVAVLDIMLREGDNGKWVAGEAAARIRHITR